MLRRPRTRHECASVPRPCPFQSCRHNLIADRDGADGLPSCALDVADEFEGELSAADVAPLIGVSRQRVLVLEAKALDKVRRRLRVLNCG
jgi:hypothetical protein